MNSYKVILLLFLGWKASGNEISRPHNELKVEFGVIIPRYEVLIKAPKNISNAKAEFQPHNPTKTSVGLSYRNLQGTISLANPNSQSDKDRYGNSKSTDIRLRYFGRNTYEFFYQNYRGYFIENSSDLDPTYSDREDRIKRPDMKTLNWGANYYHNWHESDFSQAIAFDQIVPAEKKGWGGSWFLHGSSSSIKASSPLIPTASQSQFGLYGDLEDVTRTTVAGGLGIGGLYSLNKYYVTGFFAYGLGYQNFRVHLSTLGNRRFESIGYYGSIRLGIGYNGNKNILGLQIIGDNVVTSFSKGEIQGNSLDLKAFYAYRFQDIDVGFLNNLSNWISGEKQKNLD